MKKLAITVAVTSALLGMNALAAPNAGNAKLVEVASFPHQVTGVTVSKAGRIFVNFPRWTEDVEVSVAELMPDGKLKAYPDANWNAWRNAKRDEVDAAKHFVCVQSVVVDNQDNLWVLDPGAPAQSLIVPNAPKMVKIDLAANAVTQTIAFSEQVAPQGSYLNDVRFSPDNRYAYLTDSGAKGALVVVDLNSGQARRLLEGHPSTQPEKTVQVKSDGKVLRRTDGRGVEFSADGIALSSDGNYLYWQAIKGKTLYRVPTSSLRDTALTSEALAVKVERVGENGPADGLWIDRNDTMYISAVEDDAVKVRHGDSVTTLLQDKRLRWPDTFSQGPDGTMYVTSSRIMDMQWFKPNNPIALKTRLFRFDPAPATGQVN